jgi:hypothetical protein
VKIISSLVLCSIQTVHAATTVEEMAAKLDELAKTVGSFEKTVAETKQMAHSAATVNALWWIIPTAVLVLLAIVWFVFFRKNGSRSQAASDGFFRSQLARVVTPTLCFSSSFSPRSYSFVQALTLQ